MKHHHRLQCLVKMCSTRSLPQLTTFSQVYISHTLEDGALGVGYMVCMVVKILIIIKKTIKRTNKKITVYCLLCRGKEREGHEKVYALDT